MLKYLFPGLLSLLLIISSCEKEKENPSTESKTDVLEYLPMQKGNYWIYECKRVDVSGNVHQLAQDCILIAKDTIIRGHTFSHFKHFSGNTHQEFFDKYYRDSLDIIIDSTGNPVFAINHINDTLYTTYVTTIQNDTVYTTHLIMKETENPVNVPAGTFFDALNARHDAYLSSQFFPNQQNLELTSPHYYKKGVGLIYYELTHSIGEKKLYYLANYHLE
ncbi:MAG: hypothetical protein K9H84_00940 [Bacteroidales bacterium]|nr:hypothetical protein [Bacteroidales bacterium]